MVYGYRYPMYIPFISVDYPILVRPHPWGRGYGWLIELNLPVTCWEGGSWG
jgi:hypothetical protein